MLHDCDGFPVLDGIFDLVVLAEGYGEQIDFDTDQSEPHDATDVLIGWGLCGYKHRPDNRAGGHDMSTDKIILINLPESHWRETILALSLYAAKFPPGSPQQATAHSHASVIQAALEGPPSLPSERLLRSMLTSTSTSSLRSW